MSYSSGSSTRSGYINTQAWLARPVFVSDHPNKVAEMQQIMQSAGLSLEGQTLQFSNDQGNPHDVASAKCKRAAEMVGGPVIVEETSLCFQALGGLPGPYIQEFERKLGPQGLAVLLHGFQSRAATAICIFAYCPGPGSEPVLFEGRTDGEVVPARNGQAGWESIFQIAGTGRTYAELDPNTRSQFSHRSRALVKLAQYLRHAI